MLRLTQMDLLGFKSFPQKTTIEFDAGVNCIVGPNGSGKSNIADAIQFAFGSQSGKELRASRMSGLIFAGTDQYRPLNLASVTLHFERTHEDLPETEDELLGGFSFDEDELDLPELTSASAPAGSQLNEEGGFGGLTLTSHVSRHSADPVDRTPAVVKLLEDLKPGDRISVTRRVFRDGSGGYFINGENVRLKDIDALFNKYNLGRSAVFSINQGEVEKKILETPQEMRLWLAEATGVAMLLGHKTRAQVKLKRTERNLERLEDIRSGSRTLVNDLAAQRVKAEEHLRLSAQLRAVELNEIRREVEFAQKQQQSGAAALTDLVAELAKARAEYENQTAALETRRAELTKAEGRLNTSTNELSSMREQAASHRQAAAVAKEALAAAEQAIAQARTDEEDLGEQIEALDREMNANTEAVSAAKADQNGALAAEQIAQKDRDELQAGFTQLNAQLSEAANASFEAAQQVARLNNQIEAMQRSGQQLEGQLEQRRRQEEAGRLRLSELEDELALEQQSAEKLALDVGLQRDQLEQHKQRSKQLAEEISQAESTLSELRDELSEVASRRATIAELAADASNTADGTVALLAHAELAGQLHRVGDITFPTELRPAFTRLLAHLGDALIGAADTGGTALSVVQDKHAEAWLLHSTEPSELNPDSLWRQVNADGPVLGALRAVLGDTLLADDLTAARALLAAQPDVATVVLRDGSAVVTRTHTRLGQPSAEAALKVAQHSDLALLDRQIATVRSKVEQAEAALEAQRKELGQAQWARDEASAELAAAEARLKSALELCDRMHKSMAERRAEFQLLTDQTAQLDAEHSKTETELPRLMAELTSAQAKQTGTEQRNTELKDQRISSEQRLDEARRVAAEAATAAHLARQRVKHLEQAGFDLAERRNNLRHRMTQLGERLAALKAGRTENAEQATQATSTADQLDAQLTQAGAGLNELRDARTTLRLACDELQSGLAEQAQAVARLEHSQVAADSQHERATERLAEWLTELRENHGLSLSQLLADPQVAASPVDADLDAAEAGRGKLREEKARLKIGLEALGPVNLLAIDQHQEHATRLSFLDTQAEDLKRAMEDLGELIGDLDRTTEKRYRASLRKIESRFNEAYLKLFGSGWARLRFEEPEDIINSGVEIEVQLPGSRRHNLRSLSGGQRSLIFLALFFAVHSVRSPGFCILDEADAALDDANVERFVKLIRETSLGEQFIVITHNKMTMETADKLVGVVGRPKGVSNLLTVNLREARKMVDSA